MNEQIKLQEKTNFTWKDLRELGSTDNAGRWYPNKDIAKYFKTIRAPSRAWPNSYAKAAQTKKFFKWYQENAN